MTGEEFTQRLFGSDSDGVLYLPGPVMKAIKLKPGDLLKITPDKDELRISKLGTPRPGGPTE